ncbi:hypothetical protein ACHAXR_005110 [Thalassiosira sp. AJA248-18]
MDDQTNLRASVHNEDLQQDRRLIMKKMKQRRRAQAVAKAKKEGSGDGAAGHLDKQSDGTEYNENSSYDNDEASQDIYFNDSSFHDEDLRDMKAAHEEDEQLIGGGIEDQEGLDAMNQALTSPPVAWWAMRKQWQKRRGTMQKFVGMGGDGAAGEDEEMAGPDASYRSGQSSMRRLGGSTTTDAGVVGHPVMLEDPTSMGYNADSFRQNPFVSGDKRKRTPTVLFVSRDVVQKRRMQQTMYIVAAISVVFLFMFLLEQRKLSHYAMVESPMSLSAYLAGEALMAKSDEEKKKVTLGDLGLEEFDKVHGVPEVEFGNIEVNSDNPLANEELANDPLVGDNPKPPPVDEFSLIHGTNRLELLVAVIVGWGVTPAEVFENHESPQYHALYWMAHEDVLRYAPENDHWIKKIIQRYTLAVLYFATNGEAWTNTLFFLSNYDECNWHRKSHTGYFTGAGHCEGGYITALALWGNNLKGALPPEIGSLTSLRTLSVFDNKINLPPPESITKLTNLSRLYIQRNDFKADINYLCPNTAKEFKSDCGKKGGVKCSCCSACGFNSRNDKISMVKGFA